MQFIALTRRNIERFSEAEFLPVLQQEARRARELYAAGFIRQIWQRGDVAGACIVLEAATLDEARATFGSLPLMSQGMSEFTIIPLTPYRGFSFE